MTVTGRTLSVNRVGGTDSHVVPTTQTVCGVHTPDIVPLESVVIV